MSATAKNLYVITGEGIECEKEARRFFAHPDFAFAHIIDWPAPKLLRGEIRLDQLEAQDWVFIPGGFSFSDHFGSGRLMAYNLKKAGVFDACLKAGAHLMGVCNGFQVLVQAGLFGEGVSLEANRARDTGRALGFINRWTVCEALGEAVEKEQPLYRLPVRHGEGRLVRVANSWAASVSPFLRYQDPEFDNGSLDSVAGLVARHGRSSVWGLMPHPEIALRPADHPNSGGPEFIEGFRDKLFETRGDGVRLAKWIFKQSEQREQIPEKGI